MHRLLEERQSIRQQPRGKTNHGMNTPKAHSLAASRARNASIARLNDSSKVGTPYPTQRWAGQPGSASPVVASQECRLFSGRLDNRLSRQIDNDRGLGRRTDEDEMSRLSAFQWSCADPYPNLNMCLSPTATPSARVLNREQQP